MKTATIARIYLVIVLLLVVLVSSYVQLILALILLAVQLLSVYKPPKKGLNLVLSFSSLIFAPLALETLVGPLYSVLLTIPTLFLLDQSLKEYASSQVFDFPKAGRHASGVLKALATGLTLVFSISVILWNTTLMLTIALLTIYCAFLLAYVFHKIPKLPLQSSASLSRIVVGDTDSKKLTVTGKNTCPVNVRLQSANSWVKVEPSNFTLPSQKIADASLRFTPPLAGPSQIQLQASITDERGLILTGQILQAVDLHIIPRAKYAQWLAEQIFSSDISWRGHVNRDFTIHF